MPRSRIFCCVLCGTLAAALAYVLFLAAPGTAQAAPKGPVSFINDVAPILKENCFGCHGAKNPKGKLDMTRYESFRKGGTKDDPIMPGKPEDSFLIDALKGNGGAAIMPPKEAGEPLTKAKIAI